MSSRHLRVLPQMMGHRRRSASLIANAWVRNTVTGHRAEMGRPLTESGGSIEVRTSLAADTVNFKQNLVISQFPLEMARNGDGLGSGFLRSGIARDADDLCYHFAH